MTFEDDLKYALDKSHSSNMQELIDLELITVFKKILRLKKLLCWERTFSFRRQTVENGQHLTYLTNLTEPSSYQAKNSNSSGYQLAAVSQLYLLCTSWRSASSYANSDPQNSA